VSIDSPDFVNNGAEAKVRYEQSALARRIDVVAQLEANIRVLSKAFAGCCAAGRMQLRCGLTPFADSPQELKIITTDNKPFLLSPLSSSYMVNAASTLQAALNDILRSSAPCSATGPRPTSVYQPLPGRPRSVSLPSIADLPVELPGSILQENQGFPSDLVPETTPIGRPHSQNIRRSTHPSVSDLDAEEFSALLKLFPEPAHGTIVPGSTPQSEMRSVHSEKASSPSFMSQPKPLRIQHKRSVSEKASRRRSRSELVPWSVSMHVSLPESGCGTSRSARTRVATGKTLQPSPSILEGQTWDNEYQKRRGSEVSLFCLYHLVCLFVKRDALHNETVSELFVFPPPSTLIRRIVPEVDDLDYFPMEICPMEIYPIPCFCPAWHGVAQPCPLSSFCCLSAVPCGAVKSELRELHIGQNIYRSRFLVL
jgi:hypothetical protein